MKRARERRKEERLGLGGEAVRGGQGAVRVSTSPGPGPFSWLPRPRRRHCLSYQPAQLSTEQLSAAAAQTRSCLSELSLVSTLWLQSNLLGQTSSQKTQSAGEKRDKRLQKDKSIEKHPLSPTVTLLYSVLSHDMHFIIISFESLGTLRFFHKAGMFGCK